MKEIGACFVTNKKRTKSAVIMVCSVHLHMTVHGMGKCMRLSIIVRMMVCMYGGIGIGMACLFFSLSHAPFSLALSKQPSQYFLFFERALRNIKAT